MANQTRREFLKDVGLGLGALALGGCTRTLDLTGKNGKRPDIVLIMADDMGYSDIGCYGSEIQTPVLDKLAGNGVKFTQFYNTARCCPTRASLLTGLYPHQADMGWMTAVDLNVDGYRGEINKRCVTIAEVLKGAGYGTYMAGKWHLTYPPHFEKQDQMDLSSWPRQRGFDHFYGTLHGAGSYFTPNSLMRDNEPIEPPQEGYYYTDVISDTSAEYIRQHDKEQGDNPMFMYVAYTSPHWPLHAKAEDIDKYRGRYDKGWKVLREERRQRMIDLGIVDPDWELSAPDGRVWDWDSLPERKQKEMALRMEVYAAQVDAMDQGIGRIVKALEETGRLDNTLILFLADNGGCEEMLQYEETNEGLWMEHEEFTEKLGAGGRGTYASYGGSWANASNTPFRMYKHWVHEGGISTPLIAHWPETIKPRAELQDQPGHLIDIMATCVDVGTANYPVEYAGNAILPMEGLSLVPAFSDGQLKRDAIYWEHEANKAVRQGKWKLVAKYPGDWELYDIEADRTEMHDLAEQNPDLVEELAAKWEAYAQRAYVYPLDGRGWGQRIREGAIY